MTFWQMAGYAGILILIAIVLFCVVTWWSYKRTGRQMQQELDTLYEWCDKEYTELLQAVRAFHVCYLDPLELSVTVAVSDDDMERAVRLAGQVAEMTVYVKRWQLAWHTKWAHRLGQFATQLNRYLRKGNQLNLKFYPRDDLFAQYWMKRDSK